MGIVYQKDKRVGITYAYESESYWDKEKQQPRARRKLIGRLDEVSGEIVPTREYRKKTVVEDPNVLKPGPVPIAKTQRSFYGATYLFDQIGKVTGVESDLKYCFPRIYPMVWKILRSSS